MASDRHELVTMSHPADQVFQAALGVVQNNKSARILAVHNEGRKLVVREKAMMSNPKIQTVFVDEQESPSRLFVAVSTDPRSSKALMDGKANEKSMKSFLAAVNGALDGSAPAPATPVANHYVQKKDEVPWTDPEQEPQIEAGGNFKAMYNL